MKDQEPRDDWQLEEGNQVDDRWVLRESEQQFADQWELNQAEGEPTRDWQPVEYNRPERSGFAWVLPVLITVFLLALIGYSGFILLPQLISPGDPDPLVTTLETPTPESELEATEPATPTDEETDGALPAEEPTPTVEMPTPEPATPAATDTPAPPAIMEQDFATVITTYGVNARSQPSADSEVVRVINQNESFFLFGSPAEGWLEILVTDEDVELVQGEPIQGQVAYAAAEFFDIAPQSIMRGFYEEIMAFAGRLPEDTTATDEEPDGDDELTALLPTPTPGGDDAAPDATTDTDPPAAAPEPAQVRIDSAAGLNVRNAPDTTGEILGLLNEGDTVPALGLSDNGEWVQVQLEGGINGWVFAEFVTIIGDLSPLPPTTPSPAEAVVLINATQVLTSGIVPPAPYSSIIPGDTPAVVIPIPAGVIARVQPSATAEELTLLPQGAALAGVARTADGQWIQIELPDGNLRGWVARTVVSVTNDIDTLPMEGATADEPAESPGTPILLPTPTPAAGTSDTPATSTTPTANGDEPTATVRDILLSVYPEPNSDGNAIALIPRNTRLPAGGRNAANDWVLIETESGDSGWVPIRSVILNVALDSLPLVEP